MERAAAAVDDGRAAALLDRWVDGQPGRTRLKAPSNGALLQSAVSNPIANAASRSWRE